MNRQQIESEARRLQYEIWKDRELIFQTGVPPLQAMFQPDVAARVLGLEYEYREQLGQHGTGRERVETAGLLDRRRGTISIATRFSQDAQRFTGAHEIGHVLLHPGEVLHRDRPMYHLDSATRPQMEREADYFAACYLAPRKLVKAEFEIRFGKSPLPMTHTVAFHLVGSERQHELLNSKPGSLDFAVAVATAKSFSGRRFQSLAQSFGTSPSAMALLLQELGRRLSTWPWKAP